jgi:hypothetical protein
LDYFKGAGENLFQSSVDIDSLLLGGAPNRIAGLAGFDLGDIFGQPSNRYESAGRFTAGAVSLFAGGFASSGARAELFSVETAEGAFANYMRAARTVDVSTSQNGAVFYSGAGNRALAEQFATANGRTTIEMTPGGKWLESQDLFNPETSPLSPSQASQVWAVLSERFAQGATGNAIGFVKGARAAGVFNSIEYPALLRNPNVTNVLTGGH